MRLCLRLACLLLVSCTPPPSSQSTLPGALWALQRFEQERAVFRLSDEQRAQVAREYELSLADASLAAERARLQIALVDCPASARQPFGLSPANRLRDGARVQAAGDAPRLAELARIARADWHVRRAQASGDARECQAAHTSLDESPSGPPSAPAALSAAAAPSASSALGAPGADGLRALLASRATVVRDPAQPGPALEADSTVAALSAYAIGWTDAVTAHAPLPHYLAAVYGGAVRDAAPPDPAVRGPEDAARLVDAAAAVYPDWEPDALYQALIAR